MSISKEIKTDPNIELFSGDHYRYKAYRIKLLTGLIIKVISLAGGMISAVSIIVEAFI